MFDGNRLLLFKGFLLTIDELRTQWVTRTKSTKTTVGIVIFLEHVIDINNKMNWMICCQNGKLSRMHG